jgi:hypothetical protein
MPPAAARPSERRPQISHKSAVFPLKSVTSAARSTDLPEMTKLFSDTAQRVYRLA